MVRVTVKTKNGSYKSKWKLEKHEWMSLALTVIVALMIIKTLMGA